MGNAQGGPIKRAPKSMYQGSWESPVVCGRPSEKGNLSPSYSSVDVDGNLYTVADGDQVLYKLPVGSTTYELYAGVAGSVGSSVDGHRLHGATFNEPQAPEAYDPESSSRIWIADKGSHAIRVIEGDLMRTFVGTKDLEGDRDGAYNAETGEGPLFSKPSHVLASRISARLFVYEETKPRIRIIDLKAHSVSTVYFSAIPDLLTARVLKPYYPLHVSYASDTLHLLNGASLITYKMSLSTGECEQVDPNPAEQAPNGGVAGSAGAAGGDRNTQELRQAGIHISPNANIQIAPGANIVVNGRPLTVGGGANGAPAKPSSYKVPLPSSDDFHIMATRNSSYQVVDLQHKEREIIGAPEDASIEWVIAYIPQSNTCIYKLKSGQICAKYHFLSPPPPSYTGTRPPYDLTALLSADSTLDSDFTLEHTSNARTTTWALHTSILDATPGLDQKLGVLASFFADSNLPADLLNDFVRVLYYDSTTSYNIKHRMVFTTITSDIGIPSIDYTDLSSRSGLPMKRNIEVHALETADPHEAANYLNLSTDFAFVTSNRGARYCIVADGVYAAAQWSWFRELLQDSSNGISDDRVVPLPSWCTRAIALAIVESLQSAWSTPIDAVEAALIKEHAQELKMLQSEGVPLPVFKALYSYSP